MHSIYDKLVNLHSTLRQVVTSKKLRTVTHNRLHRKDAKGRPAHDVSTLQNHFLSVIEAACDKLYKYLKSHTSTAKQARVLDRTRLSVLSNNIEDYPLIFPSTACTQIVDSGEWSVYLEHRCERVHQFDVLEWWHGMAHRLPLMYKYALQVLSIPHTSCDCERSFSRWRMVRSDKQHRMKLGTHKAYVSFGFNGIVPPP